MKLCLFASYTYKRKSIRVFRTPILVYLDVRGVEIPLLSTVSISNCRYQEAPGEVVWSDFLAQLPRRSIEILWHLTRPSGLVKCQRISILLLGNCARISHTIVNSKKLATSKFYFFFFKSSLIYLDHLTVIELNKRRRGEDHQLTTHPKGGFWLVSALFCCKVQRTRANLD